MKPDISALKFTSNILSHKTFFTCSQIRFAIIYLSLNKNWNDKKNNKKK